MGESTRRTRLILGERRKKEIEEIFTAAIEGNKEGKTAVEDD